MHRDHEPGGMTPLPPFVARTPAPQDRAGEPRPLPPWTSLGRTLPAPAAADATGPAEESDRDTEDWSWPSPPQPEVSGEPLGSGLPMHERDGEESGEASAAEVSDDPWSAPLQTPAATPVDSWDSSEPWTPPATPEPTAPWGSTAPASEDEQWSAPAEGEDPWTLEPGAVDEEEPLADPVLSEPWGSGGSTASVSGPVDDLIEAAGEALELDDADLWTPATPEVEAAQPGLEPHSRARPDEAPLATWPGEAGAWDAIAGTRGRSAGADAPLDPHYARLAERLEAFAAQLRMHGREAVTRAMGEDRLAAALAGLIAGYDAARHDA